MEQNNQTTTVIQSIIHLLFGYRYYANIVNVRGTFRTELCSFIFRSRQEALQHKRTIESTYTYQFLETISFRSRASYYQKPDDPVDHSLR